MAANIKTCYKDLLNPMKDPEKSFAINIPDLLLKFMKDLVEGSSSTNFSSAAMIIQGSASVYVKKVEYLYDLAIELHNILSTPIRRNQSLHSKKNIPKEREKKEDRLNGTFILTDIKLGKSLSCLKKRNNSKASSKKPVKNVKSFNALAHLLTYDNNDEKEDTFYDTTGEIIGNKGDFIINKCRLINSGWFLLPTVNPNLVSSMGDTPDCYDGSFINPVGTKCLEIGDDFQIYASSDDAFENCIPSCNVQHTIPDTENNFQQMNVNTLSPVLMSVDEDIGNTANLDASLRTKNIAANNLDGEPQVTDSQLIVQSDRQLSIIVGFNLKKKLLKKKAIEHKNARRLPRKLKDNQPFAISESITAYCTKTFFSIDDKKFKNSLLRFDTEGFNQNTIFLKRLDEKIKMLKLFFKRNKDVAPIDDEINVDIEDLEVCKEANKDDEILTIDFDDNDIDIEYDPMALVYRPPRITLPGIDTADQALAIDVPSPHMSHIAIAENKKYMREVHYFVRNSDIAEKIHEWENSVKSFLDSIEQRESFNIILYGTEILNSFADSNRKQTKTFRELCKNKEKWEIHRYFMAVLPLANAGNVKIHKEYKHDGSEEILITLLSRKMHYEKLEKFRYNKKSTE